MAIPQNGMAQAQPTLAPGQIALSIRRTSSVNVNGVTYDYSYQGTDRLSDAVVINLIKLHLAASGRSSLDKISCTLTKNNSSSPVDSTPFSVTSDLEYLREDGTKKIKKDAWTKYKDKMQARPKEIQTKVDDLWKATQKSLLAMNSLSPELPPETPQANPSQAPQNASPHSPAQLQPSHPAPAAPHQEIVEIPRNVLTPFANRAKKLDNHAFTRLNLALANQLHELTNPGTNHSATNAEAFVRNFETHVKHKDHRSHYFTDANFSEILKDLQKAAATQPMLINKIFASSGALFSDIKISLEAFNLYIEKQNIDSLSSLKLSENTIKESVINVYIQCIKKGIQLSEKLCLSSFLAVMQSQKEQKLYNIVVFNRNGDQVSRYTWDKSTKPIDNTSRCLFLCVDDQGNYQSIPRTKKMLPQGTELTPLAMPDDLSDNRDVSKELGILVDLFDTYDSQSLKNYMTSAGFNQKYPQVLTRLKHFIWAFNVKKWKDDQNRQGEEPGTNDPNYGDKTLAAMTADDLETLLVNNRAKVVAVGANKDALHPPAAAR